MKKQVSIFILALFLLPGWLAGEAESTVKSRPAKFSLRLSSSYSLPVTGDLNSIIQNYKKVADKLVAARQTAAVSWNEIKEIYEFSLELRYRFSGKFSLGLEASFLEKKFPGNASFSVAAPPRQGDDYSVFNERYEYEVNYNPRLTVFPVLLSGYFYPLTGNLKVYLKGGLGCYFGSFRQTEHASGKHLTRTDYFFDNYIDNNYWSETSIINANSSDFGFHAGGGLEVSLTSKISLALEGLYRMANLNRWKGDRDYFASSKNERGYISTGLSVSYGQEQLIMGGKLGVRYENNYSNEYFPDLDINLKKIYLDYWSTSGFRPARIKLDGVVLKAGVKIGL